MSSFVWWSVVLYILNFILLFSDLASPLPWGQWEICLLVSFSHIATNNIYMPKYLLLEMFSSSLIKLSNNLYYQTCKFCNFSTSKSTDTKVSIVASGHVLCFRVCLLLQLPVWWLCPQWQCLRWSEGAQKCPQCYSHPVLHRRRVPGQETAPLILPHSRCLTVSPLTPPPLDNFFQVFWPFLMSVNKPSDPSLSFFVSVVKVACFLGFFPNHMKWFAFHSFRSTADEDDKNITADFHRK